MFDICGFDWNVSTAIGWISTRFSFYLTGCIQNCNYDQQWQELLLPEGSWILWLYSFPGQNDLLFLFLICHGWGFFLVYQGNNHLDTDGVKFGSDSNYHQWNIFLNVWTVFSRATCVTSISERKPAVKTMRLLHLLKLCASTFISQFKVNIMTSGSFLAADDPTVHLHVVTITHQQMAPLHRYIMCSLNKNSVSRPHPLPFSASL